MTATKTSVEARIARAVMRLALKPRAASPDLLLARRAAEAMAGLDADRVGGLDVRAASLGGVAGEILTPPVAEPGRTVVMLHGGGFVAGSPRVYRAMAARIALAARAVVIVPDYRLAPENPFPAAPEDCLASVLAVMAAGADPRRMAIVGDSAGGNLLFGTLVALRDGGFPLPAASVALSPFTDMTGSGGSMTGNARLDPLFDAAGLTSVVGAYAPGMDPADPRLSPLFADLSGLPPTLIQCGGDEILLDDSVRMAKALVLAGVKCRIEIWPGMPHVWHLLARVLPEGRRAVADVGAFLDSTLCAEAQPD